MKRQTVILAFVLLGNLTFGQIPPGKIVVEKLYSASLENPGGENPTRSVTVYLPPGYENSEVKYPVIYFLHGFTQSDSAMIYKRPKLDKLLDKGIATGKIKPVIVVIPDHHTLYRGSFYTNSSLTGKWADFTGIDLVSFIDNKYRTIPEWESRGVAGYSMGGQGAFKMAMYFPDVFSSVYTLSPAGLALVEDYGIKGEGFRRLQKIQTREELIKKFVENSIVAMGRAYAPNLNNPPFYADFPYRYENGSLIVDYEVLALWKSKTVYHMVDEHIADLKKIKAIKMDWGRNEPSTYIPMSCKMLSQKLENLGIEHYAEEYIGTHFNKIFTDDGRVLNDMLPFFNTYLEFEE
jgi:pimeloyl-ACP methyl ester carboxylesterase